MEGSHIGGKPKSHKTSSSLVSSDFMRKAKRASKIDQSKSLWTVCRVIWILVSRIPWEDVIFQLFFHEKSKVSFKNCWKWDNWMNRWVKLWKCWKIVSAWDARGIKIPSSQGMRETKIQITRHLGEYFPPICQPSMRGGDLLPLESHANVVFELSFHENIYQLFKLCAFIHFWYRVFFLNQRDNNRSHPLTEGSSILAGNILPFGRIFPAHMWTFHERMGSIVLSLMHKENPIPKINESA